MKEKLVIKNFGPINSAELELGRFNVFIGEQATGKSTVAKLLAVCRYFSYIVNTGISPDPRENSLCKGLIDWGLAESLKEDSFIKYQNEHYNLTLKYINYDVVESDNEGDAYERTEAIFAPSFEPISPEFKNLLSELEKIKPTSKPGYIDFEVLTWTVPTSFFQNDVAAVMDNPFYLPTERGLQSIFSLGKNSIANINDSLFNQFARLDQIARYFKKETEIEPLNIVYKNEAGKGFVKKKGETQFYNLANGASGYQSTIPIVLTTKYYSEVKKKPKTFLIEEPELNLFPSAQSRLVQYLVNNSNSYGNAMLLTTHSPYVLTTLNNLLYAYKTAQEHNDEVKQIVEEKYWLDPENISVYMMMLDGTCENIVDEEEGLIKAEKIDEISRVLNNQFDKLQDIDLGITNEG